MSLISIKHYRDFWDFPRIFIVETNDGNLLLFDCKFNVKSEDYEDLFHVYLMPSISDEELIGSWTNLSQKATQYFGEVSAKDIKFDNTRRKFIDDVIIQTLER